MEWFTADLHLGHARIIGLCKRPFGSVQDMDDALIAAWNEAVHDGDTVYVMGDFSFQPERYVHRLRGHKVLIRGNHDPENVGDGFERVLDVLMWRNGDDRIWLSHYPHRVWPEMHRGARHLYGHVHGETARPIVGSMDVGVDAQGYRLVSAGAVLAQLARPTLEDLQAELQR